MKHTVCPIIWRDNNHILVVRKAGPVVVFQASSSKHQIPSKNPEQNRFAVTLLRPLWHIHVKVHAVLALLRRWVARIIEEPTLLVRLTLRVAELLQTRRLRRHCVERFGPGGRRGGRTEAQWWRCSEGDADIFRDCGCCARYACCCANDDAIGDCHAGGRGGGGFCVWGRCSESRLEDGAEGEEGGLEDVHRCECGWYTMIGLVLLRSESRKTVPQRLTLRTTQSRSLVVLDRPAQTIYVPKRSLSRIAWWRSRSSSKKVCPKGVA